MLDPILRKSFDSWGSAIIVEGVDRFVRVCRALDQEAAAKNRFNSGWRITQIDERAAEVFRSFADKLMSAMREAVRATPG